MWLQKKLLQVVQEEGLEIGHNFAGRLKYHSEKRCVCTKGGTVFPIAGGVLLFLVCHLSFPNSSSLQIHTQEPF